MEILTPTQQLALQRNLNLAVTAGAGTGKTRVLVERYLDLLFNERVDIREILAITFTTKAAAEMMNRVAGRLDELLEQTTDVSHRKELLFLRNRLNSAYISTIHAFCLRILREYPVEAQLDPDFSQLNEMQNELLIEQTLRSELEKISTDEEHWLDLFRLFGADQIQQMLQTGLLHRYELQPILLKYQQYSSAELFRELSGFFLSTVNDRFKDFPFERVYQLSQQILREVAGTRGDNEKAQLVRNSLKKFSESTDRKELIYWNNLFELAQICTTQKSTAYKVLTSLGGNKSWPHQAAEYLKELSTLLVQVSAWLTKTPLTPPNENDLHIFEQLPRLYELYIQVERSYTSKKREQGWIDFDDMLILVRDLLSKDIDLRNRIAAQFRYILVDEFQDTNWLQWEVIARLGELSEKKFFIVGDPKQSIYGFRNADVRVFDRVRGEFAGNTRLENYPGDVAFKESFRFKENLSHFINACFSRIMQRSDINQWEVEYFSLMTKRQDADGGHVEFALLAENDEADSQAAFIATRIKQLLTKMNISGGQIAILLRTRNHLTAIEEQLRRQNIPFKTIGGIGFYQRQEIYDVYHLLRFLLNPHDNPALVGLLRSPFANIADEGLLFLALADNGTSYWEKLTRLESIPPLPAEEKDKLVYFRQQAERWLQRRDRINFSELLREIFQQSGYRSIMCTQLQGEQLVANLDKILSLAVEFERSGFTTVSDFTNYLQNLISTQIKEGEAPLALEDRLTVKIMTIHQAKGLEFPVIFLPYLEQKLRPPNAQQTYFDERFGLISRLRQSVNSTTTSSCIYDLVRQELRRKELAELKRLFYVGCTRAQDQLFLCAGYKHEQADQIPEGTPLAWLLQALHREPDDFPDGEIITWDKCTVHIRRSFEITSGEEDSTFSTIFASLRQLREKIHSPKSVAGVPLFLKSFADRPEGEVFSATQLMAFRHNPQDYYRRYHLGYFEGDYENFRLAASLEEKSLLKGKLLHRYLQFQDNQDIGRWLFEFEISDQDLAEELSREVEELAVKIRHSAIFSRVLQAEHYRNEVKVMMQLDTDFLTGTLDKIFKNESNEWEILDYKTNRIGQAQVEEVAQRYQIQIETYAVLLAQLYPQQASYSVNFYFTHLDYNHKNTFEREKLVGIRQRLAGIIQEIKKQFEPYTTGR